MPAARVLDDGAEPLGRVVAGFGNDGESGYEGCRAGRALGTYLHGPLLPRNPWLADWLLAQAIAHRTGGDPPELGAARRRARGRRPTASPRERARARGGRFSGRPEGAEVHGRVAGRPALQEALDRRVQDDLVELLAANSRWPRTAASCEVTCSSDCPVRSPAKMMCTTCLAAKLRTGAIESTIATGPSTGTSAPTPDLLGQLAVQRVDEALARVHPAAGQQPVLLAVLLVPAEQDASPASAGSPRRGSAARPSWRDEPKPRTPRSLSGSSSTSTGSSSGTGSTTELCDPHAGLDHERLAGVGVEQHDPDLAAIALVDQPRRVHDREPVPRGEAGARLDEACVAFGDRDREAGADERPLPGPSSCRSQAARSSPASPA